MSGIFSRELAYRLQRPLTWFVLLLMVYQGIAYSSTIYDRIINEGVWLNAAAVAHINMAGIGFLVFIVIAVITGSALYRDIEHRTAPLLYTCPVNEKRFFLERFAAAFLINIIIILAYVVGMLLVPWLPGSSGAPLGPAPLGQMAWSFVLFKLPNLLLLTAVSLALVVIFRRITASYLGMAVLMVLLLLTEFVREHTPYLNLVLLLDPLGYGIVMEEVGAMRVPEKNTAYFPLSPILIANRLLWLSVSCACLLLAYRVFSFKRFIATDAGSRRPDDKTGGNRIGNAAPPPVVLRFTAGNMLGRLFRLSWRDFATITRPAGFRVVIAVLALLALFYHVLWQEIDFLGMVKLPLTYEMAIARQPMSIYLFVLLALWTIETLFKDRTVRIWEVTESLPVPTWVLFLSRFIAMAAVGLVFVAVLLAVGLLVQIGRGFTAIDWTLYLQDLLLYRLGWLTYLQIIALALFVGAVINSRYAAHVVTAGILFFIFIALFSGMIEEYRYLYAYVPGVAAYSEVNGYGIFGVASFWYGIMWTSLAAALALLAFGLWNRGAPRPLVARLRKLPARLSYLGLAGVVVAFTGFGYAWSHVQHNVYGLADYRSSTQKDDDAAAYETAYRWTQSLPHPVARHIDLRLDLYPDQRRADIAVEMLLENEHDTPIETLHVEYPRFASLELLEARLDGAGDDVSLISVSRDTRFRHDVYRLSTPLPPGQRLRLHARGRLQYRGFTQDEEDPQAKVTDNGSFLGSEILPQFGYDHGRKLLENRERIARNLPRLASRKAAQDDPIQRRRSVFSRLSPRATADITVSTPASQIAFGPGKLVARREDGDRLITTFSLTEAASLNWHIGSAAYEVAAFTIGRPERPVQLEIHHHPGHAWNIGHIRAAAEAALAHLEAELGPYPYRQLRIAGIPYYAGTSHAYPNVIAIPENHGWLAAVREPADAAYVYYVVARALAAQVLAHHLDIADVQGAGLFTRTLPEHYALELVRQRFGDAVHADALAEKADDYRRGRGREPNAEPALLYSDGADYVEAAKGPIVLAYLDERAGQGALNRALASFVARYASTGILVNSTDLLEHLERQLPAELHQEMRELFLRTDLARLPGY